MSENDDWQQKAWAAYHALPSIPEIVEREIARAETEMTQWFHDNYPGQHPDLKITFDRSPLTDG